MLIFNIMLIKRLIVLAYCLFPKESLEKKHNLIQVVFYNYMTFDIKWIELILINNIYTNLF